MNHTTAVFPTASHQCKQIFPVICLPKIYRTKNTVWKDRGPEFVAFAQAE